jgi:hypothetical protein
VLIFYLPYTLYVFSLSIGRKERKRGEEGRKEIKEEKRGEGRKERKKREKRKRKKTKGKGRESISLSCTFHVVSLYTMCASRASFHIHHTSPLPHLLSLSPV